MRHQYLTVRLVPVGGGALTETGAGHVIARPGQKYAIEITNHSWKRAVVDIGIDGTNVTTRSVVIGGRSTARVERPGMDGEHGRFTVCAEGDEDAFGLDGGRENRDLGLVVVEGRLEVSPPTWFTPCPYIPSWSDTVLWGGGYPFNGSTVSTNIAPGSPTISYTSHDAVQSNSCMDVPRAAAGTGLSGHSDQAFTSVRVGRLSDARCTVMLRLVIGEPTPEAAVRPLPGPIAAPARPAARP